jgi:ribosomal protein L44E
MNARELYWAKRNCERKRGYNLEVKAKVAGLARMNARKGDRAPLRVYKCDVCGLWHLTSKKAKPNDI